MSGHVTRWSLRVATAAVAWSVVLCVTGGFDTSVFGLRFTTHDPVRPLLLAVLAFLAFLGSGGDVALPIRRASAWVRAGWRLVPATVHIARVGWRRAGRLAGSLMAIPVPHRSLAAAIALAVALVGAVWGTKIAGGADSYGYISQADLWLSGHLRIEQPFMAEVPWPASTWTFAPLGYRRALGGWGIVPTYPPGLPMLLAVAKGVAGQEGVFVVVPLLGAVLVLATYALGTRLASPAAGLVAAWLVATSPIVLAMTTRTMTDVPVAAAWATSFWCLLGRSRRSAVAAGLWASLAVLIRPNLVTLTAAFGLRYAFGVVARGDRVGAFRQGLWFSAAASVGIAVTAFVNNHLYGSPFASGYGPLAGSFSTAAMLPNLWRNLEWFTSLHSAFGLVGLAVVFVPLRRLWTGVRERYEFALMALFVVVLWSSYLAYVVDLRFLLGSFPLIMLGTGVVASALLRPARPLQRFVVIAAVLGLGSWQIMTATDRGVFEYWRSERRYSRVALLAQQYTPDNSVIVSLQHSGTIRYYGGRMTMRYDLIDDEWLDPAVVWLTERGVPTFLMVEDWELQRIQQRFIGTRVVEVLQGPPVFVYHDPGTVYLFNLSDPPVATMEPVRVTGVDEGWRAARPALMPAFTFAR